MVVSVVIALSCGNKSGKAAGNTDSLVVDTIVDMEAYKHSEDYIRQRIDTIYKFVGKLSYNEDGTTDYNPSGINHDSAYCSERYYALMKEALQLCDETGDILYDYDYWVCGQDISDDWSYKVAKVYNITDSTALVAMIVHNFSDIESTIALRYERGDWYIDDFSPSDDGQDDKKNLRDMIQQGLEARKKAKALVGYWGWMGDDCPELLLRLEMTDHGLKVTECNIYRMYGFDHTTATYNGTDLNVTEYEYDSESMKTIRDFSLFLHLDDHGDLTGTCRIMHPLASKDYDGPITLRKGYFKYHDGASHRLSDYVE